MRRADTLVILLIVVLVWPSVAQAQASETVYYFHTDAIGSVRMITDAAGQEVARYDYLPFGEEWGPTSYSNIPNDRKFAGLQRDAETGFDYALARYYRSQSGRFTQPDDPGYGDPHDAQSMQLYGYARNNPLTYVDPTGHQFAVAICGNCTDEEIEENARKREWIRLQLSMYPWLAAAVDPFLAVFLPVTPREQAHAIAVSIFPTVSAVTASSRLLDPLGGGLLAPARTNLLSAAKHPQLRDAINQLYRSKARIGSGSSMDAFRFENATGRLLSPTGHAQKLVDRRRQLQSLLRDPSLSPSERRIVKDILIDIQNALSGR